MENNTPIIIANTEWMPPEKLLNEVRTERMVSALCDLAKPKLMDYKDLVGDAECLAYLMPQACRGPLSGDWTKIYLYLAGRILKKWNEVKNLSEDTRVESISEYQQKKLNDLKYRIYKSRGEKLKHPVINILKEVFFNCNGTE